MGHETLKANLQGEIEGGGRWQGKFLRNGTDLQAEMEFEDFSGPALSRMFPRVPWHQVEQTRMAGRLEVSSKDLMHFPAKARFEISNLGVHSPRISKRPVKVDRMAAGGDLEFLIQDHRLCLKEGWIETGQARATVQGDFFWDKKGKRIALDLEMPPTPAAAVIQSIPGGLSEDWRDFEVDGNLTATLDLELDFSRPGDLKLDIDFEDDARFRSAPGRLSVASLKRPFQHVVFVGDRRHEMKAGPGSKNWVPLSGISPFMIQAVLAHEDAAFFRHRGFAPWAIETALARNLRRGRFAFGASTITMQLAKNLYLSHEKTMDRKVSEAILTWWLERELSKSEILELYLNVIEYGPGVYGLRDAAHHYFRKSPARLTPAESVFLACILPAPRRYHRQLERGALTDWYREQMEFLLEHMVERGRIDATARDHGMEQIDRFRFRSGEDEAGVWGTGRRGESG